MRTAGAPTCTVIGGCDTETMILFITELQLTAAVDHLSYSYF